MAQRKTYRVKVGRRVTAFWLTSKDGAPMEFATKKAASEEIKVDRKYPENARATYEIVPYAEAEQ